MVVKCNELKEEIQPPLPDTPRIVSILVLNVEWINSNWQNLDGVFIHKQSPLILASYFRIHKSQGKTLDCAVINLGESENVVVGL